MKINKALLFVLLTILFSARAFAAPVNWTFKLTDKGNGEIALQADAVIDNGWHLYGTEIPEGGPYPTGISIDEIKGAVAVGDFHSSTKATKVFDKIFEMEVTYFDNKATFIQNFKVTDKNAFVLKGDIRAQACNDSECTPPLPIDFNFTSSDLPAGFKAATGINQSNVQKIPSDKIPPVEQSAGEEIIPDSSSVSVPVINSGTDVDLWSPVIDELKAMGAEGSTDGSLLFIFISGFLWGFVALVTPCVWPMIPMTVSFFLKRNKSRGKAVREAITYGVSIIVIYVSLGLIITAIFGPSALNDMATGAVFNLIFFALLIFFAASFLGAFDLTLPSSWTTKMDNKADSATGLLSIFFMAFTLALVSFSCTGPLIGTLLVEAVSLGSLTAPAMGMLGFALALSIPFTLFAVFPSLMENMPKSGGWLNSVKVVLGFAELALALKFLSVADLAYGWGILDREVFLSLWIVIFLLMGVYLLGKIKFAHDSDVKHISVVRLLFAIASFSFAVYMVPGLWGAPLKAISAFAPPMYTQDFNLYTGVVHAKFDDYEAGMKYAKDKGKPVLIDFSGYGCVNCRKMEASVWTNPQVKQIIENDYVLITLMVDDKKRLPQVIEVEENGKKTKLKTVGDKWSYLQRHKFGTNSQPYYVMLDMDGKPIGPSYAYNESIREYFDFLNKGLTNFKNKK